MNSYKIAYAPEDNYVGITLISMVSVLENNPNNNIEFLILNADLNERSLRKIEWIKKYQNCSVRMVDINKNDFKNFPLVRWVTTSAWYRTKIAELCPDCDKVLYLDSDTMVLSNLDELFQTDLKDNYVGVVPDRFRDYLNLTSNTYFNSGVILINCEIWRKENVFNKIKKYVMDNRKKIKCADQDVLNVICDTRKLILPKEYNYGEPIRTLDVKRMDNAKIVHFVGPNPNRFDCVHSYRTKWLEYAIQTPFYDEFVNQNIYNIIRFYPKFIFDNFKYKLLSKITTGKTKEKYRTKYILLKQLVATLKY